MNHIYTSFRFIILLSAMFSFSLGQLYAQCGLAASLKPKVSSSSICSGNTGYVFATGWPVAKWLFRDNNAGSWAEVVTTNDYYSMVMTATTPTIRTFKAVLSTINCTNDTTAGVDVNIVPIVYSTNLAIKISASKYTTCSGASVRIQMMNQSYTPTQWLYRDNGGIWNVFSAVTTSATTNIVPSTNIKLIRDYRIIVQRLGSCTQDSSDIISVTINPAVLGNNLSIRPNLTQTVICGGSNVSLGTDWPFEVGNWMYRDAGNTNWQVFSSGSSSATDIATNVSAATNRSYRVMLMNAAQCTADTSETSSIAINPSIGRNLEIGPRITGNPIICAGTSQTLQLQGFSSVTWYYRDSLNGVWNSFGTIVPNMTLTSNASITKDIKREVRVVVNNVTNFCSYDTTAISSYTIKANMSGNNTLVMPYVGQSERCIGAASTVYLSNAYSVSGWCWRDMNAGAWTAATGGSIFTDLNTSFTGNTMRSYRALINNNSVCSIDTTAEVSVQFKLPQAGGIFPVQPALSQVNACAGTYINATINLDTGRIIDKWMYRDNANSIWVDLPKQVGNTMVDSNTLVSLSTKRTYVALVRNLEKMLLDTSLEVSITIQPSTLGKINLYPVTTRSVVCNNNKLPLSISVPADYTLNYWIAREFENQAWTKLSYGAASWNDSIATVNTKRMYRVVMVNASLCKMDTSEELSVNVMQRLGQIVTEIKPVVNLSTICSGTALSLSVNPTSGGSMTTWMYRDNGSAWKNITSSNTTYNEIGANTKVIVSTIRDYRAVFNNTATCTIDTSNFVSVNIGALSSGITNALVPRITTTSVCAGNAIAISLPAFSGAVQKWIYRDNNAAWSEFNSVTSASSMNDNNTNLVLPTYREYRALAIRTNTCQVDTTLITGVSIKPYTYGNVPGTQPIASSTSVCSGVSYNVSLSNFSGSVIKWLYRMNHSGEWRETDNASLAGSYTEVNLQVLVPTIRSYRAVLVTNGCSYDTSAQVTVQQNPRTYTSNNNVTPTSTLPFICSGTSLPLVSSGTLPTGASIRKWMYMDNGSGVWTDIPFSTSTSFTHTNTTVTVATNRAYRIIISNPNGCSFDSSGIFYINIQPLKRGIIGTTPNISSNNICSYQSPPTISISGYNGSFVKWLMNTDNTSWVDFPYSTGINSVVDYTVNLQNSANRAYRALISNTGTCSIDSSNTVSVSIAPIINGNLNNIIPTSTISSVCYAKVVNLNIVTPANYIISKWIYRNDNGVWQDVAGSSSLSQITDNNTLVSSLMNRTYRVLFVNSSNCRMDTSGSITVQIKPRSNLHGILNISPNLNASNICAGSVVNLSISNPLGSDVMQWLYSDYGAGGPWISAVNSMNLSNYNHFATQQTLLTTRLYRALLYDSTTCNVDSTQTVTIKINPIVYKNNAAITVSGPDTICAGSAVLVNYQAGTQLTPLYWLSALNNGGWQKMQGTNGISGITDNATLYASGTTKLYKAIAVNMSSCSMDTLSKLKPVFIIDKSYGTTASTVFITGTDTMCAGSQITVYSGGTVERWLYSDGDKLNWQVIPNNTGSPLVHNSTQVTNSGWRYYRAIHNSISCVGDSSLLDSVYLRNYTKGYNSIIPTSSFATICAGSSYILSMPITPGQIQKWIYNENAGPWKDFLVTANMSVAENSTFVTASTVRNYKVIALKNCSYDTSASVAVSITPKVYASDLTKVPTAGSVSICSGDPVTNLNISSVTTANFLQWLYRDNGGNWNQVTGNNLVNVVDYNTGVTATTTRDYIAVMNNAGACRIDSSAKLTVTIKPIIRGNSNRVPVVPAVACIGNNYSVNITVQSDTNVVRWLYNMNGAGWVDRGYLTPTLSSFWNDLGVVGMNTMSYRAMLLKTSTCRLDTTQPSTVTLNTKVFGKDTLITPTAFSPYCALSTTSLVSVTPGTGNSTHSWIYSDNGGGWNVINSTSATLFGAVNTTQTINRKYCALINKAACGIDTSVASTVVINPPVYGSDTLQKVTVNAPKLVCASGASSVTASIPTGVINKWLYRDGFSTNWNVLNISSLTNISDYNSNSQVTRQYSNLVYKSASCRVDTTAITDTAFFISRVRGVDTSIKITSPTLSICAGTQISLTTTGVGSNSILQWIYSDNGGQNWSPLSSQTGTSIVDYNTDIQKSLTRTYRVLVKKAASCASDSSDIISVGIRARINSNDTNIVPMALNNSVCSGMMISLNTNIPSGRFIQKWLVNVNGGGWKEIANTGSTSLNDLSTVVSTQTFKQYKVLVTGYGCTLDTSSAADVSISPGGVGYQNQIIPTPVNPNVCSGATIIMRANIPIGTKVLKWLYREKDSDPWLVINNTTDSLIDTNTTYSQSVTRRFRLVVLNASGCSIDSSAFGSVNINPLSFGNIASTVQSSVSMVCAGTPISLLANVPSGYMVEEWLRKTGTQNWTSFSSQKTINIIDTNTTLPASVIRLYRARLKNTLGCNTDSTVATSVQVNLLTSGTNLTYTPYSANTSICSGTIVSISLFGVNGVIKNWYSRDTITSEWKVLNRTDNILIDTATSVTSLKFREYRALLFDAANCRYDTTNSFKLTINPRLVSNADVVAPTSSKTVYCTGNTITLNAAGFINGGKVQGWLYSDKNGPWNPIASSDSATIHHTSTTITSLTTRKYRALVLTGCATDTSAALTVTIDVLPYKPIVLRKFGSDTLMSSEIATTYQWKFNTTNLSGGTNNYWVAKQNGNYSLEIGNSSGCKNLSDAYAMLNVSVEDATWMEGISLFPNPTYDGKLKIEFRNRGQHNYHFEMINALGEMVHPASAISVSDGIQLDLSNQSEGIYLVRLSTAGTDRIFRVIVRK